MEKLMTNPKLTPDHLQRQAIVYIRQSTPTQVLSNKESQRRQYGLADYARELGFRGVEIIDDDLGRSGCGLVERPGYEHLVAEICSGQVGAVFCIEASRLARNGREWHHLIEMCGLINALVIDPEGMYDPRLINDRLLLGLRGTMSEFELNLIRQRCVEAIRQKARRGELQFRLPVGFCWTPAGQIEIDPDLRVQQAIRLAFQKLGELGSVRGVFLGFHREGVLPPASDAVGSSYASARASKRIPHCWQIGTARHLPYAGEENDRGQDSSCFASRPLCSVADPGRSRQVAGRHRCRKENERSQHCSAATRSGRPPADVFNSLTRSSRMSRFRRGRERP
jgi:DNA invertase Pin-like site-specific DNA recombinase